MARPWTAESSAYTQLPAAATRSGLAANAVPHAPGPGHAAPYTSNGGLCPCVLAITYALVVVPLPLLPPLQFSALPTYRSPRTALEFDAVRTSYCAVDVLYSDAPYTISFERYPRPLGVSGYPSIPSPSSCGSTLGSMTQGQRWAMSV